MIYDDVPDRARAGVTNVLRRHGIRISDATFTSAVELACIQLDIEYDPDMLYTLDDFLEMIDHGPWHEFYDFMESLIAFLPTEIVDEITNDINEVLRRNYVGYELSEGMFQRVGDTAADATIAEARGILKEPRFSGPNDQFLKAVGFLSQRPRPDPENCVKEAAGAVEGVARIVLGNPKILLSDAAKEFVNQGKLHPALRKVIDGVYGYRGDEEGVTHGQTEMSDLAVHRAEFVLSVCAAMIVYIAREYGIGVGKNE